MHRGKRKLSSPHVVQHRWHFFPSLPVVYPSVCVDSCTSVITEDVTQTWGQREIRGDCFCAVFPVYLSWADPLEVSMWKIEQLFSVLTHCPYEVKHSKYLLCNFCFEVRVVFSRKLVLPEKDVFYFWKDVFVLPSYFPKVSQSSGSCSNHGSLLLAWGSSSQCKVWEENKSYLRKETLYQPSNPKTDDSPYLCGFTVITVTVCENTV